MSANWTAWEGIPLADCTLSTCPLVAPDGTVLANNSYDPSLAGNAFYLALFALTFFCQLGLGVYFRTWGFMVALLFGVGLEVCGYAGRIGQSINPFDGNTFMLYLITITIAPAFICAGIYLTLARIVVVYSSIDPVKRIARFNPRVYAVTFVCCDIICLLIQIIGGLMAVANTIDSPGYLSGVNLMIGGISLQVVSLFVFMLCALDLWWHIYRTPAGRFNTSFSDLRRSFRFRGFLWAVSIAVITIVIRSTFRIAELSGGFNGPLFNQQVTFMILEGMMMSICVIGLVLFHPGIVFNGRWAEATWSLRGKKQSKGQA